ncbi:MAG: hypothetical protein JO041_14865 [Acidobacteria bacterium]|nr:hypothetical protein [Acidobacteriota bacterium]
MSGHSPPSAQERIPGNGARTLVVRLGSLGDIVHTLPAVALLRDAVPGSIDWVVEERWAELLCSRRDLRGHNAPLCAEKPLVNTVHTVRTRDWRRHPFRVTTLREITASVAALRSAHYDLALDFQGAMRSAVLGKLAGPGRYFGFARAHEEPAGLFYNHRVEAQGRHMVEQNISLALAVPGGTRQFSHPPMLPAELCFALPRDADDDAWAADQLARLGICEFCLLNAGAGWGAKIWPATRWAEVARGLAGHGLRSVVNFGPSEENLARTVERESGGAAVAVASSISQLIALARRARLCVGGDTGPTHLAAALGVPIVAIYGPTDPVRNGPFAPGGARTAVTVLRSEWSITDHARHRRPEPGMLRITPGQVIAACRAALDGLNARCTNSRTE